MFRVIDISMDKGVIKGVESEVEIERELTREEIREKQNEEFRKKVEEGVVEIRKSVNAIYDGMLDTGRALKRGFLGLFGR